MSGSSMRTQHHRALPIEACRGGSIPLTAALFHLVFAPCGDGRLAERCSKMEIHFPDGLQHAINRTLRYFTGSESESQHRVSHAVVALSGIDGGDDHCQPALPRVVIHQCLEQNGVLCSFAFCAEVFVWDEAVFPP